MIPDKHTVELEDCSVSFLQGDVVHTHFKEHRLIGPFVLQQLFGTIERERPGGKVLHMVSLGEAAALNNEARIFASSEVFDRLFAADAIVVRDLGHQLAANVFVRHHRPGRPVQLFADQEHALTWLAQQHHLIDPA